MIIKYYFTLYAIYIIILFIYLSFRQKKKGASPSEYGLVFGVFELIVFIISPIYGQYVSNII